MKKILLLLLLTFDFLFANAQINLQDGLTAFYNFDVDANDYSGNENHGTLIGNATTNEVLTCGDNDTDALSIPHTLLDGLEDFSIGFEIKFAIFHEDAVNVGRTNIIISGWKSDGINPVDNELNVEYIKKGISENELIENAMRFYIDNQRFTFSDIDLSEDTWYNLIITRTSNILHLYLNGEEIGSGITATATPISIQEGGLIFGQEQDALGSGFHPGQCMAGQMDNLCLYNRALNQAEINEIIENSHRVTVSIEDVSNTFLSHDFTLFPNPLGFNNSFLYIKNAQNIHIESIHIFDLRGSLISEHRINSNDSILKLQPFNGLNTSSNTLIINLILKNGEQLTYKVIISRA